MEASPSTTTTTNDDDDDTSNEVVCFYNREGQKVPKNATKLIVGPDVVRIDEEAFYRYQFLKEVDMSKATSLRTIGKCAFYGCRALALVKWPPNLKTIGNNAFNHCTSLKDADMSKLHVLETIGERAFEDCRTLALVKWPPNLKTIGNNAFYDCKSLKESDMSMLHALETIGRHAFYNCSALALVRWPPTILQTIGDGAFEGCRRLQNVAIPSRHHWCVRELPFDDQAHELLSVDMQGHDLRKAIRIKNLFPKATPNLPMNRLVQMYAMSPLTAGQLDNVAKRDETVAEFWNEVRVGDLHLLGEIEKAYCDSMFKLVQWCTGKGQWETPVCD